jgi:hypothetical protein
MDRNGCIIPLNIIHPSLTHSLKRLFVTCCHLIHSISFPPFFLNLSLLLLESCPPVTPFNTLLLTAQGHLLTALCYTAPPLAHSSPSLTCCLSPHSLFVSSLVCIYIPTLITYLFYKIPVHTYKLI